MVMSPFPTRFTCPEGQGLWTGSICGTMIRPINAIILINFHKALGLGVLQPSQQELLVEASKEPQAFEGSGVQGLGIRV